MAMAQKMEGLNILKEKYNNLLNEKTQMSKKLAISQEQINNLQKVYLKNILPQS